MPGKIFVSYRRDDDPSAAARVRDALAARFGKANIFMDVDNLLAGLRFDEELAKALAACDVFIAIIGVRWTDLLKTKAASGERDYVCEEIAEALKRKIAVIPVRAGRDGQLAPLPRPDDLPPGIRDLVHYQKHDVTHEHFGRDASALAEAIVAVRRHLRPASASVMPAVPWGWISATALSVLGIGYAGAYYSGVPVPWPVPPAAVTGPNGADLATQVRQEREARAKAEAEAKRLADAVAQTKREQEARDKAEREAAAKRKADDDARAESKRVADAETAAKAKAEADRLQAAALAKQRAEEEAARRDAVAALAPGSGQAARDRLASGQPCPMCPQMVVAPSGSFTLGSPANEPERESWQKGTESPQLKVTIARPFAVGKYAITFDEWDACVADGGCNGYKPADQSWGRGKRPVINVNWDDAKAYSTWLSRKTGKTYRLLSEAEREYVARAGMTTPFWWGSSITPKQANYDGNYTYAGGGSKGEYRQRTVPVESFEPNPWGLYQVHGNVWEWTEDCWNDSNSGNPGNGSARTIGECGRRVVRGGSWNSGPRNLRSANRGGDITGDRYDGLGFRVARTLNP